LDVYILCFAVLHLRLFYAIKNVLTYVLTYLEVIARVRGTD